MPFQKGQSGNPKGRAKKGRTLTDLLSKQGDIKDVTDEVQGKKISKKEALAKILWAMALREDLAAMKYIYNRLDGLPVQTLRTGADEPLEIVIKRVPREENE